MHKDYYKYPNGNYIVFLHKDIPTFVSRVAHSFFRLCDYEDFNDPVPQIVTFPLFLPR